MALDNLQEMLVENLGISMNFQRKHDKLCPFPATAIIPTLDLRDFERLRANESSQRHRWIVVTDSWKTLVVGVVAVG